MKNLVTVALILLAGHATAATPIDNSTIMNAVLISTGATVGAQKSPYTLVIDLARADSTFTGNATRLDKSGQLSTSRHRTIPRSGRR